MIELIFGSQPKRQRLNPFFFSPETVAEVEIDKIYLLCSHRNGELTVFRRLKSIVFKQYANNGNP